MKNKDTMAPQQTEGNLLVFSPLARAKSGSPSVFAAALFGRATERGWKIVELSPESQQAAISANTTVFGAAAGEDSSLLTLPRLLHTRVQEAREAPKFSHIRPGDFLRALLQGADRLTAYDLVMLRGSAFPVLPEQKRKPFSFEEDSTLAILLWWCADANPPAAGEVQPVFVVDSSEDMAVTRAANALLPPIEHIWVSRQDAEPPDAFLEKCPLMLARVAAVRACLNAALAKSSADKRAIVTRSPCLCGVPEQAEEDSTNAPPDRVCECPVVARCLVLRKTTTPPSSGDVGLQIIPGELADAALQEAVRLHNKVHVSSVFFDRARTWSKTGPTKIRRAGCDVNGRVRVSSSWTSVSDADARAECALLALQVLSNTKDSWDFDKNAAVEGPQEYAAGGRREYERLEHLGDAVLKFSACLWCYLRFPNANEGQLSLEKQQLVSTDRLAQEVSEGAGREACFAEFVGTFRGKTPLKLVMCGHRGLCYGERFLRRVRREAC